MPKLSVTLLFIGLSLLILCDGSSLSQENPESNELDTTEFSGYTRKLQKQCKTNTGTNIAFSAVMESIEKTATRFKSSKFHEWMYSLKIDFFQMTNATRQAFFTKYCSEARSFHSCFDDLQASLRPCFKEHQFNILEGISNSFLESLDLACRNNGEIIYKLKDESRMQCFRQKFDRLSECADTVKRIWNLDWDVFELTQDQCSLLTSYRECLKDIMDACDLSEIVSIYDISMNALLRMTPCLNNTEDPKIETHLNNATDEI